MKGIGRAATLSAFVLSLCFQFFYSVRTEEKSIIDRDRCFTAIFSFGNSLTDTGNFLISNPILATQIASLPYGETFFRKATGRCSEGRLVVDFIAASLRMGLLEPYLNHSGDFSDGANFAVAGATSLNSSYLNSLNITPITPYSLQVQIDCEEYFGNALFFFGETGGNDFNYQFLMGRNLKQVRKFVQPVLQEINRALRRLINKGGGRYIVVQNNYPVACSPSYLAVYGDEVRDSWGCIPRFNDVIKRANKGLEKMVNKIKNQHPDIEFVMANNYGAATQIVKNPGILGIKKTLEVCCGVEGNPYNYNPERPCGSKSEGSRVCEDPQEYASWDGIHLTEAAYRSISAVFVNGDFMSPPFRTLCPMYQSETKCMLS